LIIRKVNRSTANVKSLKSLVFHWPSHLQIFLYSWASTIN